MYFPWINYFWFDNYSAIKPTVHLKNMKSNITFSKDNNLVTTSEFDGTK